MGRGPANFARWVVGICSAIVVLSVVAYFQPGSYLVDLEPYVRNSATTYHRSYAGAPVTRMQHLFLQDITADQARKILGSEFCGAEWNWQIYPDGFSVKGKGYEFNMVTLSNGDAEATEYTELDERELLCERIYSLGSIKIGP